MSFRGPGDYNQNIIKITDYDDEGMQNVAARWSCSNKSGNGTISVQSSDTDIVAKFGEFSEIQDIDLKYYSDADRATILGLMLTTYGVQRPRIVFECINTINAIAPLDRVEITSFGSPLPIGTFPRWGSFNWGDGTTWAEIYSSFLIRGGSTWYITSVEKRYYPCRSIITAERRV